LERILFINLLLAKEILEMKLPDEVLNRMESDKSVKAVATSIKKCFTSIKIFNRVT